MKANPKEERAALLSEAEVLRYLDQHPKAKDTLEGIAEWWMLEQRIHPTLLEVKAGLARLVEQKLVIAEQGVDGRTYYRANPERKPLK